MDAEVLPKQVYPVPVTQTVLTHPPKTPLMDVTLPPYPGAQTHEPAVPV